MQIVIKASEIDVSRIIFLPLEESKFVKSQRVSTISYGDDKVNHPLRVQTPEMITESYGIPQTSTFYPDAKSRSFYKLPFCHDRSKYGGELDYAKVAEFYNKLAEIDKFCDTDEFRTKLFGKHADRYAYQPLVRDPEDESNNQQGHYRPPYTKVRLDLLRENQKPNFVLFSKEDGKREQIELDDFEDVVRHIKYLSKLKMIVTFSKLYAMKTSLSDEKKKYGIILKATHIEVSNKNLSHKIDKDADPFTD